MITWQKDGGGCVIVGHAPREVERKSWCSEQEAHEQWEEPREESGEEEEQRRRGGEAPPQTKLHAPWCLASIRRAAGVCCLSGYVTRCTGGGRAAARLAQWSWSRENLARRTSLGAARGCR